VYRTAPNSAQKGSPHVTPEGAKAGEICEIDKPKRIAKDVSDSLIECGISCIQRFTKSSEKA
jgi:hypothetical protein